MPQPICTVHKCKEQARLYTCPFAGVSHKHGKTYYNCENGNGETHYICDKHVNAMTSKHTKEG